MEGTQTTQTDSNDAAMLSGGPAGDHGKPMPKDGEVHPDLKEKVVAEGNTTNTKFELNGKTFDNAKEASQYVADLERKLISPQPAVQTLVQTQTINQKELIDGQPLDEVMFTNPTKFAQHLETKIQNRFNQEKQIEENKKIFWTNFYSENPDLKGKEEIVEAFVAQNYNAGWKDLPLKEFGKVVADTSRARLKKAGLSNATHVPNNAGGTLSSSGGTAPKIEQERQKLSLVDEMRAMKTKRTKAR